jgi:hypothetical protein
MSLKFNCPECNQKVITKHLAISNSLNCPYCRKEIKIPSNAQETDEPSNILSAMKEGTIGPVPTVNGLSSSSSTNEQMPIVDSQFNTLLSFGQTISFIGWIMVGIGIILGLLIVKIGVFSLIAGVLVAALGIVIVAYGQTISCFVAIARNTRATYEVLLKGVR